MLRSILTALALIAIAQPAAAAEKRVWRVDSVIATQAGTSIVVEVKGAVQSGGWSRPRLRQTRGDAHTLVLEFLAQAPAANAAVITALLPVTARITLRGSGSVVAVKAMAEANEVTAQILH